MSDTNIFKKLVRQRGTHGGIVDSATGYITVPASGTNAGPTNVVKIGEGIPVLKVRVTSVPKGVTGTYALTQEDDTNGLGLKRPDGTMYPALPAPVSLGSVTLPANGEVILEPAQTLAALYGPTKLVATGASTNGAAVPVRLEFTVDFLPELEKSTSLASAQ